jgi:hypothetical protein
MANGYRLEQIDILKKGHDLVFEYVAKSDYAGFYKEAWIFVFELEIDIRTAKELGDVNKLTLYTKALHALSNLVEGIISRHDREIIMEEFNNGPS